ncbi:hypothetical protein GCM10010151_27180 [Actinoallomurus spadix]|uniref:Uncharacterized protein n=1 Tax=Actinoallomurus spadix TaxID=79912 RepID=A0ABN0WFY5_9ACTN
MPKGRPGNVHGRYGGAQRRQVTGKPGDLRAGVRDDAGKACARNGVGVCLPGGSEQPAGHRDARHGEQATRDRQGEETAQAPGERAGTRAARDDGGAPP